MTINNTYDRTYAASPVFPYSVPAITTDEIVVMSWETYNASAQKYLPFNLTRIVNNSTVSVWFYPNQDTSNGILIVAGTIQTIDRRTIPALRTMGFQRISGGGNTSAGQIIVTNSREGQDAGSVVARLHKRLFGGSAFA